MKRQRPACQWDDLLETPQRFKLSSSSEDISSVFQFRHSIGLPRALLAVSDDIECNSRCTERPRTSLDVSTTALRSRLPRLPIQHTVSPSSHPSDGLKRRSIRRFTLDDNCLSLANPDMAFHAQVHPPFDIGDIMFVPRSLKRESFAYAAIRPYVGDQYT